jgi:hypothetical protein
MPQTVHEQLQSRSLSVSGGRISGSRTFHVYDDSSPITQPVAIQLGANGMPAKGDLFPGETSVYAISYTADPLGDGANTWRVTWTYGPNILSPSDIGYVERTVSTQGAFFDVYRVNVPSSWGGNGSNGSDIGGTSVDSGGNPTSTIFLVITLGLVENVLENTVPGRLQTIATMVGKRNSQTFEGFAAGTLVYKGANSSRIGTGLFALSHQFEFRNDYHMVQQPRRNSQNDVILASSPSLGFVAQTVYFVQPFPQTANFNLLSENF